jgi:ATP-binding cassette subfamily B multidrug efflux pump
MLLRLLRRFLRPYAGLLVGVVVLQTIGTLAALWLPTLNAAIIDDGLSTGDIPLIWRLGGIMLAASLVQVVCTIAAVWYGSRAAMGAGRDIRSALFSRVLSFSARELNQFGAPTLITRNTNDVQQIQLIVFMSCTMLVAAPITMAGGVFMAVREDPGLSLLLVVAVPLLGVCMAALIARMHPLFRQMQTRIDTLNRVLR